MSTSAAGSGQRSARRAGARLAAWLAWLAGALLVAACASGCLGLAPDGCARGLVLCGGRCIDPLSSQQYCGASGDCAGPNAGRPCTGSDVCQGGTCQFNPPPRSYIFPGATAPGGGFPRPPNLAIAAPLPGTIYYTFDGSVPTRGGAATMSAPTPVVLPAVPGGTRVRWFADYGGAIGREFETHSYDVIVDEEDNGPPRVNFGFLADAVTVSPPIAAGVEPGPLTLVSPGTEVTVALNYQVWRAAVGGYCPGCVLQVRIGVEGTNASYCRQYNGPTYPGEEGLTREFTVTAPEMPGRYFIRLQFLLDFRCPNPFGAVNGGLIVGQIMVR